MDSLSTSTSTGMSSLSTGLSTTVSNIASLSTGVANSVQYDNPQHTSVTLGGAGATAPVTLTNVAAGVNPTDAVNFGQLTSLSTTTVSSISSLSTGLVTTNSTVNSLSTSTSTGLGSLSTSLATTDSNVASLSTGLTTTNSNVSALSTGLANGTVGLVQQVGGAPGNGAITVGASTGGTVVDFTGTDGARQLTGVAAGTNPTDAVNVSQLQAVAAVASNAVLYDNAAHTSVTLGGTGATSAVALTNVAAGTVSATSTDAINGSQLYQLQSQFGALVTQLTPVQTTGGTDSKYVAVNSTGNAAVASGTESVSIGGNSQASGTNTVALGSGAQASANNATAIGANAVVSATNSVAIGAGSVASSANTVSVGSVGNERTISNVAPGVNPTDAANVAQLQGVQQNIDNVARNAYSGIAMAGALAGLPQVEQGKTFQLGAGIGNYGGYTALAVGASARVTENTIVKMGVSATNGSRLLINAGVGYSW
ncbi:YadA-like family protein [Burkholderia sp. SRS-W-2-2016]|uniref:YadA family autotransporter adhesin n=1 Tax=Burkholderia sp. SRS-W-2-2016 TaxID=1926878 RepID=UPI002116DF3E|nr:YadA-like family protein [Burkholderia sp. SRS-W-2-2016]